MFRKPFAVKKNVNLRNSDIRKLLARLPPLAGEVVDKKAQVAHVKVVSYHNHLVNLYTFEKEPLFFDFDPAGVLYPTVFFLWKAPGSFPVVVVHEPTLQFLENGADLMLPGVIRNKYPLPTFAKGDAVVICLHSDGILKGPVAVGSAMLSSGEMELNGFQGKGLQNLHVFHDTLWEFGSRGPVPSFQPVEVFPQLVSPPVEEATSSDFPSLADLANATLENKSEDSAVPTSSIGEEIEDSAENGDETQRDEGDSVEEPMEDLLLRCFIAGLKFRLTKSGELPLDVGQFYAQCLLKCVPPNRRLDMKKTKYKKFGVFLDAVNKHDDGHVVKISKKGKGVDLIAEVAWSHPLIRSFEVTDERTSDEPVVTNTMGPIIREVFAVTEPLVPLFRTTAKISRGDLLEASTIRELITQYVKMENLTAGKSVRLDPILAHLVKSSDDVVDWNTLMQKVQAKMTKTFILKMPDGREFIRKVSMPKIVFKVESRAGNKKVTLINNISVFGIEAKSFCHEVQVGVATSATVTAEAVMCEGPQITVQGNQVAFLGELLMSTYGINKKYIEGLELAPKKKK